MESSASDVALEFKVTEPRHTPLLGLMLAYGAMVPILLGVASYPFLPLPLQPLALLATILWAASILLFLSGVRRGLSFRTAGGATVSQVVTVLWLYGLGLVSLGADLLAAPVCALVVLLLGYATLAVLDPIAARRGEAPLYFARLRPAQMAIPMVCLGALLVMIW